MRYVGVRIREVGHFGPQVVVLTKRFSEMTEVYVFSLRGVYHDLVCEGSVGNPVAVGIDIRMPLLREFSEAAYNSRNVESEAREYRVEAKDTVCIIGVEPGGRVAAVPSQCGRHGRA